MKGLSIITLLISTIVYAKNIHQPLKSMLLKSDKIISVNLKERGETYYKVKEGDTISSIASEHHITIEKIKKTNKLSDNQALVVGSKLKIPDQTIKLSEILAQFKNAGPILKEAKKYLGREYVWGANGPKSFDCSGFTCYVCKKNGICLPRTSAEQGEVGTKISRSGLKRGDLIFFDTSKERKGVINHVGIYIGDNKFIHASSGAKRVVISSLNQDFYKQRFLWGRRVREFDKLSQ